MAKSITPDHGDHDCGKPLVTCPNCGLVAPGPRCPRCNALTVAGGCSGGCFSCKSHRDDKKPGTA